MKILLVSKDGIGAWFSLRLQEEGHSVDYYLLDKKFENVLGGIAPSPLFKKPSFESYDLVLFDSTGNPKLAEESLKATPTLGDGNLNSQLEDDRLFGIEIMEQCDINVPPYECFSELKDAKKFVQKTGKRYVFKPFSVGGEDQDCASTYVAESAEDMLRYFDRLSEVTKGAEFLLQEVVEGTEISTEAWFNGEEFTFINGTLEEKKFMNGRKGPNTGCSGNLVWLYENEPKIFTEGLGKLKDFLQDYSYKGMVDLNTIVGKDELYGLEWTPRFGYDASATLFSLLKEPTLGEFFGHIATGSSVSATSGGKFAAGVRLSIPPYPTEVEDGHPEGVPINGIDPEKDDIAKEIFLYDAMLDDDDNLVSAGVSGFIAVPISKGASIRESFAGVDSQIDKIKIPDMQYRTDIEKCVTERYEKLEGLGWLK